MQEIAELWGLSRMSKPVLLAQNSRETEKLLFFWLGPIPEQQRLGWIGNFMIFPL